jgi:fermentation-respiration switch protein FrsA (DUF1100 family)
VRLSIMTWLAWSCAAILCYGFLCWRAERMMYYPMRYPEGAWSVQQSLGADDVWLNASDGTRLHSWWIDAPNAKFATVHLHGNGGNITHRDLSAQNILAAGSSVLLLDYRGYGKSDGRPSERGLYRDAEAAYDSVASRGFRPGQIIIHGESLGTAVATWLATKRPCAGVVLEAPFTSAKAVAARVLPVVGPALIWGYDNLSRINQVRAPLLIIHGDRDEIIAYEFGQQLFAAAGEPKSFWTIPGASHNDLHVIGRPEFPSRLAGFYSKLRP